MKSKTTSRIFLATVFLTCFAVSCTREALAPEAETPAIPVTLTFRAAEAPLEGNTKTGFGALQGDAYPVLWDDTDVVGITADYAADYAAATITPSGDKRTGTFKADVVSTTTRRPFSVQAVVPASRIVSIHPETNTLTVNIPASQTPSASGPDPQAMILVAGKELNAVPAANEVVALPFHHATAYGRLTLTNLPTTADIRSIDLIFNVPVTGKWDYSPGDRSMAANVPANIITLQTDRPDNNCFACAPADLSGQSVLVRLNTTTDGMYETRITVPNGKKLQGGVLANMVVDMAGSNKKKDISVFTIGNSYSDDVYAYLDDILTAAGFTPKTHNIYISGCSLEQHVGYYQKGDKRYARLAQEDWEYVVLHQVYTLSGVADSYDPHLWDLIDLVRRDCPKAKLIWYPAWACQQSSSHTKFKEYYNRDQMTMFNAIQEVTQNVVLPTGVFGDMIPATSLVQNLRTSPLGDNICRDNSSHLTYKIGRYAVGLGHLHPIGIHLYA